MTNLLESADYFLVSISNDSFNGNNTNAIFEKKSRENDFKYIKIWIISRQNMFSLISRTVMEDGISSQENQNECHMPDLPVDSPEMMAFLKNEPPIQCDDVEAWVSCGTDLKVNWISLTDHFYSKKKKTNSKLTILQYYSCTCIDCRCHGCAG